MSKLALKDTPLQEITLRKYEEPGKLDKRELSKKFLLSIGLLNPGESRDVIVDIFTHLLNARAEKKVLPAEEFAVLLKDKAGASLPNIRRQLRRLKELKFVEHSAAGYRIAEFGAITPIIEKYLVEFLVKPAVERVKQYAAEVDKV